MKTFSLNFSLLAAASVLLAGVSLVAPSQAAADDAAQAQQQLLRMATCQDSWYDMRRDEGRMRQFAALVQGGFEPQRQSPAFLPRRATTLLGHPVVELYPQSVGMGVGFSVALDAPFERAKADFERALGKPLTRCESGDGMHSCELPLGEKKTAILMAPMQPGVARTLLGCYYFYQQ